MLKGNILKFNNTSLQYLYLGYNNLSGILPSNVCQLLPNLRYLYLHVNNFYGEMPKVWRYCKELEDLELSANNFDKGRLPPDIGKLIKLQYLYLSLTNLHGKIFSPTHLIVYLLFWLINYSFSTSIVSWFNYD
jgi:Leucine-rich repeat (LRR) protein